MRQGVQQIRHNIRSLSRARTGAPDLPPTSRRQSAKANSCRQPASTTTTNTIQQAMSRASPKKSEWDVLKKHHKSVQPFLSVLDADTPRFNRSDDEPGDGTWEERLAKGYEDKLFRELALVSCLHLDRYIVLLTLANRLISNTTSRNVLLCDGGQQLRSSTAKGTKHAARCVVDITPRHDPTTRRDIRDHHPGRPHL